MAVGGSFRASRNRVWMVYVEFFEDSFECFAPFYGFIAHTLVDLPVLRDCLVLRLLWNLIVESKCLKYAIMPLKAWVRVFGGIVYALWKVELF